MLSSKSKKSDPLPPTTATGLPTPNVNHARAAADLALAMQREAARLGAIHDQPLRMRIGLHTGPVVAGVIGAKKFAYDLWGDTVNLASRMESHAQPGGILVTAATYECLRNEYVFQPSRMIRIKGKGVKNVQGYGWGDLHVRVTVEVPTHLNAAQRAKLQEFAELCDKSVNPISQGFFEKARNLFK